MDKIRLRRELKGRLGGLGADEILRKSGRICTHFIESENYDSVIYNRFLSDMSDEYVDQHRNEEIVRDFIAGMTDQYFLRQCPENLRQKLMIT